MPNVFSLQKLKKIHLYLGVFFAPLILYFAISGAWQLYGFQDLPDEGEPSAVNTFFHELSKPHTHSTKPGLSPKTGESVLFNFMACAMAVGLVFTTLLGLILAFRVTPNSKKIAIAVVIGMLVPILLLFVHAQS